MCLPFGLVIGGMHRVNLAKAKQQTLGMCSCNYTLPFQLFCFPLTRISLPSFLRVTGGASLIQQLKHLIPWDVWVQEEGGYLSHPENLPLQTCNNEYGLLVSLCPGVFLWAPGWSPSKRVYRTDTRCSCFTGALGLSSIMLTNSHPEDPH